MIDGNNLQAEQDSNKRFLPFVRKNWVWIVIICALILLLPFVTPAGYFLWGLGSTRDFFHEKLDVSYSLSIVFAIIYMFVYALALPIALRWMIFGNKNAITLLLSFFAVFFVFGSKPLLTYVMGSSFDTKGLAQKCYVWRGGNLIYSERGKEGCGTDPVTGQQTTLLTPEIAAVQQRQGRPPQEIKLDGSPVQFFNPASGRPKAWFEKLPDGRIELFDAEGFSPRTGVKLLPVTSNEAAAIRGQLEKSAIERSNRVHDIQQKQRLRRLEAVVGEILLRHPSAPMAPGENAMLRELYPDVCRNETNKSDEIAACNDAERLIRR